MGEFNVQQPSPQIGVGFGVVKKFREIYVIIADALNILDPTQAAPVALGDLLAYTGSQTQLFQGLNVQGHNIVKQHIEGDGFEANPAGFASYEAVVNATGIYGYKPQAGDPIGVYRKGRFFVVNVDGVVADNAELVVGTVAGSVRARPGGNLRPTIGKARIGNNAVAGDPIEAEIDLTIIQNGTGL